MTANDLIREELEERSLMIDWRFGSLFRQSVRPGDGATHTPLQKELRSLYPHNADEITTFLTNVLKRRQSIVERLSKHPELNDHGFFMVICKMYIDSYHGIGHTNSRITHLIELFASSEISRGTAARKLRKANELNVFVTESDSQDSRKQRYYLHPEMIELCSEAFGGMIEDIRSETGNQMG